MLCQEFKRRDFGNTCHLGGQEQRWVKKHTDWNFLWWKAGRCPRSGMWPAPHSASLHQLASSPSYPGWTSALLAFIQVLISGRRWVHKGTVLSESDEKGFYVFLPLSPLLKATCISPCVSASSVFIIFFLLSAGVSSLPWVEKPKIYWKVFSENNIFIEETL